MQRSTSVPLSALNATAFPWSLTSGESEIIKQEGMCNENLGFGRIQDYVVEGYE